MIRRLMLRWPSTLAWALSLLLFVSMGVLWVRSYDSHGVRLGNLQVEAWRGRCVLIRHRTAFSAPGQVSVITSLHRGSDGTAVLTATVCDPATPAWNAADPGDNQIRLKQHLMSEGQLLSRRYVRLLLAPPGSFRNLGGFGVNVVRLDLPRNWSAPLQSWDFKKSDPVLWSVAVPMWLPTVLLAGLPLRSLFRVVRAWRPRNAGLCSACGYDLRASPDRCPECGEQKTRNASKKER